jgi:hypothetical protein
MGRPRRGRNREVTAQPPPASPPIIARIVEEGDPTGIADVLLGALGLTGGLALLAVLTGLVVGGLLYWLRSRETSG